MPQRFLRPGITNSSLWNRVSFEAQSLFIRLLTLVDDFGRYDGRVAIIHGHAFSAWNSENPKRQIKPQETAALCSQLENSGLVEFYEADGKRVLQILQWNERSRSEKSKHPDKEPLTIVAANPLPNPAECQQSAASIVHRPSSVHHRPSYIAIASPPAPAEVAIAPVLSSQAGFLEAWESFKTFRVTIKKKMTARAEQSILKTLSERPAQAISALELSERKGWQDVQWAWFDNSKQANGSRTHIATVPLRADEVPEIHDTEAGMRAARMANGGSEPRRDG